MRHTGAIATLLLCLMSACSSTHSPAPVVVLNSQPTEKNSVFDKDTYTVQYGDTLFAIAWYSGNDYRDIAKWNNIYHPYTINAGQILKIRRPNVISEQKNVNLPTPKTKDPTTPQSSKKRVETSNSQAYGEDQNVVSRQKVTESQGSLRNEFPTQIARWVWPLRGKVIETFKQTGDVNKGIDIQASLGTSVVSAAAGKVVYTGSALRGYGNLVIVKHSDTFLSAYAHNDTILVKERQWVKAGQPISTVGNSGTDKVKLHFEIRYRGKSLDPLRFLPK